jgi:hypothetical protein
VPIAEVAEISASTAVLDAWAFFRTRHIFGNRIAFPLEQRVNHGAYFYGMSIMLLQKLELAPSVLASSLPDLSCFVNIFIISMLKTLRRGEFDKTFCFSVNNYK